LCCFKKPNSEENIIQAYRFFRAEIVEENILREGGVGGWGWGTNRVAAGKT